jgi:hypothetical protein
MRIIMERCSSAVFSVVFASLFLAHTELQAVNRFFISDQTLELGSTGNIISVRADADQDLYGFSISLEYDRTKIRISGVQLGAAAAAVGPEWNDGTIDNTAGILVHGVVFDLSGPTITKKLNAGTNLEVLRLMVDVVSTSATSAVLDLVNRQTVPARLNVMTNMNGESVSPPPTLVDGTLTLRDLRPDITSFLNNTGNPGKLFFVIGTNFDQPGLTVKVCNVTADHELLADNQTIQVTAPNCSPGPATVEVCTSRGCDSDPNGFIYSSQPGAPIIDAYQSNLGAAGKIFFIVGRNFTQPGLRVMVCGTVAEASLLADDQTISVVAPSCGTTGPARVEVCTNAGCDFDDAGFTYTSAANRFIRGDCNGDGQVSGVVTDAVFLLNFNFSSGPAPPCRAACDANGDGSFVGTVTDAVFLLQFNFLGGPAPPAPFPACGTGGDSDRALGCVTPSPNCR